MNELFKKVLMATAWLPGKVSIALHSFILWFGRTFPTYQPPEITFVNLPTPAGTAQIDHPMGKACQVRTRSSRTSYGYFMFYETEDKFEVGADTPVTRDFVTISLQAPNKRVGSS